MTIATGERGSAKDGKQARALLVERDAGERKPGPQYPGDIYAGAGFSPLAYRKRAEPHAVQLYQRGCEGLHARGAL